MALGLSPRYCSGSIGPPICEREHQGISETGRPSQGVGVLSDLGGLGVFSDFIRYGLRSIETAVESVLRFELGAPRGALFKTRGKHGGLRLLGRYALFLAFTAGASSLNRLGRERLSVIDTVKSIEAFLQRFGSRVWEHGEFEDVRLIGEEPLERTRCLVLFRDEVLGFACV